MTQNGNTGARINKLLDVKEQLEMHTNPNETKVASKNDGLLDPGFASLLPLAEHRERDHIIFIFEETSTEGRSMSAKREKPRAERKRGENKAKEREDRDENLGESSER